MCGPASGTAQQPRPSGLLFFPLSLFFFWLFPPGGRQPEKQGQLGQGWHACELGNTGWRNMRFLDSPWLCWLAAYTLLTVTVCTRSSPFGCHILGLCCHPKSHPSPRWLQAPASQHIRPGSRQSAQPTFTGRAEEPQEAHSLPREHLKSHPPCPLAGPSPTHWLFHLYSDSCPLSSSLEHRPSL